MSNHARNFLSCSLLAFCIGCSGTPFRLPTEVNQDVSQNEKQAIPSSNSEGESNDSVAELATENATTERAHRHFGQLFARVLPTLDRARELVDRHENLPDRTRLPFKADKQSNAADLNELLDEAIDVLDVSEVTDYRQRIREANHAIAVSHQKIADYQRQRVSASWAKEQSQLEKVNPFKLSKEAIDERIRNEHESIEKQQVALTALKTSFVAELARIGVQVDDSGVDALLHSVSGDDIVTMSVVFDNIKQLTVQFQELTEESGEALDAAKRYYGMYVVMIHVMDRIQDTFISDIREEHIPRLKEFADQADHNIAQAHTLLDASQGDSETLEANITSNRLTKKTALLYVEYLERNAELVAKENEAAQVNLATAMNTYNTVKLSSDVAALMSTGRRNFDTLMRLQIPALREFDNDAIRKEFQRMTEDLRAR